MKSNYYFGLLKLFAILFLSILSLSAKSQDILVIKFLNKKIPFDTLTKVQVFRIKKVEYIIKIYPKNFYKLFILNKKMELELGTLVSEKKEANVILLKREGYWLKFPSLTQKIFFYNDIELIEKKVKTKTTSNDDNFALIDSL